MSYFVKISVLLLGLNLSTFAYADANLLKKHNVQKFIRTMVTEYHFNINEVISILDKAHYNQEIVDKMNTPYEKKPWGVYRGFFLTDARLKAGLAFWKKNEDLLNKVQNTYGVPASMIVSILGVETLYGERQGNYKVLDALATLAFYYPKREVFFQKELAHFMLLCKEHHVSCDKYYGSYAGAMGQPQFMPSSYRAYAVDYSHKGIRDLMHDDKDAVASVANYFHKHGWVFGAPVATQVNFSPYAFRGLELNSRFANISTALLVKRGILSKNLPKAKRAGILKLEVENKYEYWVAYPNFYVITRYNSSPQYALAVFLLAQQLERGRLHS